MSVDEERRKMIEAVQQAAKEQGIELDGPTAGGVPSGAETAPASAPAASGSTEQPPPLPIDWATEPTPAAANGVQVVHSPQQFALLYTDLVMFPGRNAADGQTGHERARVVSSVRLDPDTYFQALCVMASNWNKFAETHLPPQMRRPRFKLLDAGELQLHGIKPPREEE